MLPGMANNDATEGDVNAVRFCVLGSGSGGNCSVLQVGERAMLIDAGFGPRAIASRLHAAGLPFASVRAICVTHLDQDHFRPSWILTLIQRRITVFVHEWHLDDLMAHRHASKLLAEGLIQTIRGDAFYPIAGVEGSVVHLPHDQQGTVGFSLATPTGRIGFATDLGSVPTELIDTFTGVDLLAIESNYDPDMQRRSPRPAFLKRRIMGRQGHLSNEQSFRAVRQIFDRSEQEAHTRPNRVVLLHRSSQCNCPTIVREVFNSDARVRDAVVLTEQRTRTPWLAVQRVVPQHAQLQLSFG